MLRQSPNLLIECRIVVDVHQEHYLEHCKSFIISQQQVLQVEDTGKASCLQVGAVLSVQIFCGNFPTADERLILVALRTSPLGVPQSRDLDSSGNYDLSVDVPELVRFQRCS